MYIRVLQRNKQLNIHICLLSVSLSLFLLTTLIYLNLDQIYYKELAYMVMEAENSHDLFSVSYRPKKANGVFAGLSAGEPKL